jgi:hypothetical protein
MKQYRLYRSALYSKVEADALFTEMLDMLLICEVPYEKTRDYGALINKVKDVISAKPL